MYDFTEGNLKFQKIINIKIFEKLTDIKKFEYLIENKIFKKDHKVSPSIEIKNDGTEEITIPGDYSKFEFNTYVGFIYKGYWYSINKKICDEFYDLIKINIEEGVISGDLNWDSNIIYSKIKHLIRDEDKLKILNLKYLEYCTAFTDTELSDIYLNVPVQDIESWKDYVIIMSEEDLFIYLTAGFHKFKDNSKVIKDWIKLCKAKTTMDYCKKNISEIEKNQKTTTNNKSTTNDKKTKDKYYSPVFLGQDEENIFFKILEVLNAFNENKSPKKRYFNPLCDAIFNSYEKYQKEIFKHNLKKSEYSHYLKSKYPNEFKSDRLSDGYIHIESVNEVFPQFIKMLKQQKLNKTTTSQQQANNKIN